MSVDKMYEEILKRESCPVCETQNTEPVAPNKRRCCECGTLFKHNVDGTIKEDAN